MPSLPVKLKHDAIVEAVFEIRFDPGSDLLEVVLGRLADPNKWPGFLGSRLPTAEIPNHIRLSDPNLINLPLIDLQSADGRQTVKVGTHAIVCGELKPYGGWAEFNALNHKAVEVLFQAFPNATVRRLGLRYINVLEPERHHVGSIAELQMSVSVGGTALTDAYILAFRIPAGENTECLVRVATKDFASPPIAGTGHTLIDTDTYTPAPPPMSNKEVVFAWLDQAHAVKNTAFFNLFSEAQIADMKED